MNSNGSEIRKTQQEREEMEQKTPEARLKIVKELVRKTREERKNMEHKTQEQGTRMMNKAAAHISVRSASDTDLYCSDSFEGCEQSIEEREKMVQKIQRLTTRVMQNLAARYHSYNSFAGYDKMEQRTRIQKLIQKQLTTRQSDFHTSNRFEGDKKSKWVDHDDNARSAVSVCFAGVHITGTKMIDMEDDYSCWEDDYSCWGFNGFVSLGRVDPFLTNADVMKARSAENARSAARLYFDRVPRLRKDDDDESFKQPCKIIDMEDEVSLERVDDPFPDETYVDVMKERALIRLEEWLVEETIF